jgi:hypothetical protein
LICINWNKASWVQPRIKRSSAATENDLDQIQGADPGQNSAIGWEFHMQIARLNPSRDRIASTELARLRRDLQAEHARLLLDLTAGHDRLIAISSWLNDADIALPLTAYKTLIAIVEREDFLTMPLERMPVVLAHIASRLDRLGKLLRAARLLTMSAAPASLH